MSCEKKERFTILLSNFYIAKLNAVPPEGAIPDLSGLDWITANPGRSVHYDLMDAGRLKNPFASHDAAVAAGFVTESDWVYKTEFALESDLANCERFFLELSCVDTFADIFVNGERVGACDNMFTPWHFELTNLKSTNNVLLIHVKAHARMVADKADKAQEVLKAGTPLSWIRERSLVRRYQRSYSEDYAGVGQAFWGIGLLRPVTLAGYGRAFIERTGFAVKDIALTGQKQARAELTVNINKRGARDTYALYVTLTDKKGAVILTRGFDVPENGVISAELAVDDPLLWYPAGYGDPNLYTLTVTLKDGDKIIHRANRQVGFKKVELLRQTDTGRHDFRFVVNGKPVYVKGGNWIPVDALNAGGDFEQTDRLLKLALNAGMNMMRFWGGGVLEPDRFYDRLDQNGILIWQDALLHSHPYPDYDDDFNEAVRKETITAIEQLRSHPAFAVFCGGNELQEGWDAWGWKMTQERFYGERLIYDILPKVCEKYCPEIPYVSNSPHGEKLSQSPVDGETHTWGNFYNATEDPLFVTETCWYSGTVSRPETLEKVMGIQADDFTGMGWNVRWAELLNRKNLWQVNQYTEYHMNDSLRTYARGLEIEQMTADYMSLYYLRTRGPSCTGILYWPFNKGGPMMNYGCVDYGQNALMPYYLCVRLFKPVVLHAYRDSADIRVRATNDGETFQAKLTVTLFDTRTGKAIKTEKADVTVPEGTSWLIYTQSAWYKELTSRWRQAVHVKLTAQERTIAEDFLLFCPLFEVETEKPVIYVKAEKTADCEWTLAITANTFIKHLALECDEWVIFSDNYFMLRPDTPKSVRMTTRGGKTPNLTVQALDHDAAPCEI